MSDIIKKHVIAVLIDNEFGALARVVELFSARGCNIETLCVAPIASDKKISRITITTYCTNKTVELICKLLERIVPVHASAELTSDVGYIERELALVQIIGDKKLVQQAQEAIGDIRCQLVDQEDDSWVFEIIGSSLEIENAVKTLENYGLATVSRTGIAAGFKGKKRLY